MYVAFSLLGFIGGPHYIQMCFKGFKGQPSVVLLSEVFVSDVSSKRDAAGVSGRRSTHGGKVRTFRGACTGS